MPISVYVISSTNASSTCIHRSIKSSKNDAVCEKSVNEEQGID